MAIKEENATSTNPAKMERDKKLSEKMLQMRHRLREHEQKRIEVARQFLHVDHRLFHFFMRYPVLVSLCARSTANYAKFKKAVEMDAKNEQCPVMPTSPSAGTAVGAKRTKGARSTSF